MESIEGKQRDARVLSLSPSASQHFFFRLARDKELVDLYAKGLPFCEQKERNAREMKERNVVRCAFFRFLDAGTALERKNGAQASLHFFLLDADEN